MNLEFFIARRLAARTGGGKPGVMVRIAVISVALSVAVMILAMAVIMGFKRDVTRKMTGIAAHAVVTDVRSLGTLDAQPVLRGGHLEALIRSSEGFVSMQPYAVKGGIVKSDGGMLGAVLKGVDGSYDFDFLREHLLAGELPRVGDSIRTKEILLSRPAAEELELQVGDRVEMLFVEQDEAPRRDRFKVAGIYSTGMDEMDKPLVFTDLRNVQRLAGWRDDQVSGYEIRTSDVAMADEFAHRLDRLLLTDDSEQTENLVASSVREQYPNIFDWLRAHDVNAAVIIVIMLVVALFNMASALLILVLERTRMIGLLKAMGMRSRSVRRIFLWRAAFITLRGVVWGNLAGLALCLAQQHFHLLKLSSEGYLLSEVPVQLSWGWWLGLNAGAAAVILLLLTLPTYIVSSVKPDETIRYE